MLLFTVGVSGTLAYIFTNPISIENIFNPSKVSSAVVENDGEPVTGRVINIGSEKKDVKIQNTGDTEAYIRVVVVVNWKNEDGTKVLAQKPSENDYTINWNVNGEATEKVWAKGSDGYYYYTSPVPAGEATGVLINSAQLNTGVVPPTGTDGTVYHLSVEIVASAIQSTPASTVAEQWGVTVDSEGLISK